MGRAAALLAKILTQGADVSTPAAIDSDFKAMIFCFTEQFNPVNPDFPCWNIHRLAFSCPQIQRLSSDLDGTEHAWSLDNISRQRFCGFQESFPVGIIIAFLNHGSGCVLGVRAGTESTDRHVFFFLSAR